jgi:hypothetical protein
MCLDLCNLFRAELFTGIHPFIKRNLSSKSAHLTFDYRLVLILVLAQVSCELSFEIEMVSGQSLGHCAHRTKKTSHLIPQLCNILKICSLAMASDLT